VVITKIYTKIKA